MRRYLAKGFSQILVKMTLQTIMEAYNPQISLCQAQCCLMKIWDKQVAYLILTFHPRGCMEIIICLCQNALICYKLFLDLMLHSLNSNSLLLSQRLAPILSTGSPMLIIKFCLLKRVEKFQKFLTRY